MDEGAPIAYELLEAGVPVLLADGSQAGTVERVLAAPKQDIFHGLVVRTADGPRFVSADQVASLHEHGADLRIDAAGLRALPRPEGGAPVYRDAEPGAAPHRWRGLIDRLTGKQPPTGGWRRED